MALRLLRQLRARGQQAEPSVQRGHHEQRDEMQEATDVMRMLGERARHEK